MLIIKRYPMSTDFNAPCKFHDKQKVKIISGFHKGKSGIVINVDNFKKGHETYQMYSANNILEFGYIIKVRTYLWFSREIHVTESQIERTLNVDTKCTYEMAAHLSESQARLRESNTRNHQLEGKIKAYEFQIEQYKKRG